MPGKVRRRPEPPEFVMRRLEGVPLTFLSDAGEQVKEDFVIDVKSYTAYGFLKLNERLEGRTFFSEEHLQCGVLAETVVAITDCEGNALTEETGEPATLTDAFFMGLLAEDREAIHTAIKADANPRTPSSSPGDSGSSQPTEIGG